MIKEGFTQSCCCSSQENEENIVKTAYKKPKSRSRRILNSIYSVTISLLIGLFPKCPVCWAAYMSIFGSYGISKLPYMPWLMPILIGFLGFHLFLVYRNIKNKGMAPFIISVIGAFITIGGKLIFPDSNAIMVIGMVLILMGSLWNSFSFQRMQIAN